MTPLPTSLSHHRVRADDADSVVRGEVRFSPMKSLWFAGMAAAALVGGALTFTWTAFLVFLATTGTVLLLGHSLGSHRKLIHDSYQCPKWLEYALVYCGVQVGLAGPIGLLRQHELRDYAQRLPDCHDYLRHGSSFWKDAWWQLNCELHLANPPRITIEARIANDRFYRFLEQTWMLQQLPPALALYALGGWAFVFWGTCARVTAGVVGHWLIGFFAHNRGGMHYEVHDAAVQGRNIRFTSLLTMGESWHNNHHAFPGSARLGLTAGEWDPGWWVLMVLRKLGLVWSIRLPAQMPRRAELAACDDVGAVELQRQLGHGPQQLQSMTLRQVLRACWKGLELGNQRIVMTGPAAILSAAGFRRLGGPRLDFHRDAAMTRLTVRIGERQTHGLVALCIALSLRNPLLWVVALCALPLALSFEATREAFDIV